MRGRWLLFVAPLMLCRVFVCGSILCIAGIASAQSDDQAPAAPASLETKPTTIEEYRTRVRELNIALREAKRKHDNATRVDLETKTASLQVWADQHVHGRDPALASAGFVMLAIGAPAAVGGAAVLFVGMLSNCALGLSSCRGDSTAMIAGGAVMAAGALLALGSIPMILSGNKKVMDTARVSIMVGATRIALSVSF